MEGKGDSRDAAMALQFRLEFERQPQPIITLQY